MQYHALVLALALNVVGVDQERQRRPVRPRSRFYHIREVVRLSFVVKVRQILAAELRVLLQVIIRTVGDALKLAPAEREEVLHVNAGLGVVGELVLFVVAQAQVFRFDAVILVPLQPRLAPILVPLGILVGRGEELHLHLLELARPVGEVARRDLVAERLPDLGDPEGRLEPRGLLDVEEVDEYALSRLRAHIDGGRAVFHRPHEGLEHQVEAAHLGKLPAAFRALV
ncbi:hypothetical protein R80B4_02515 [Fibrobacteres bacterium R8-0-B4]